MTALRFTESAEHDLLEACLFVAEENPLAADAMLDRINAAAPALSLTA